MLFARWQHHLWFCSGFPYAPLKAMVTKISKWSRIQDSFRIAPKIKSLVVCAIPDIPSKFQKDPSITFWVILYTHTHGHRQTDKVRQKHYLLGGGKNDKVDQSTCRDRTFVVMRLVKEQSMCHWRHYGTSWRLHEWAHRRATKPMDEPTQLTCLPRIQTLCDIT